MNTALPEMLQCSNLTVLERQRACLKWQEEQFQQQQQLKCNYEKMASVGGKESFKKRKAEKWQNSNVVAEESKRIKACEDEIEESKITGPNTNKSSNNKKEASGDASKENSKVSEVQKPNFIHIRKRRGQATNSHSLAESVRREKISERMKSLQDLVPGCNKITGKARMLDEIINK